MGGAVLSVDEGVKNEDHDGGGGYDDDNEKDEITDTDALGDTEAFTAGLFELSLGFCIGQVGFDGVEVRILVGALVRIVHIFSLWINLLGQVDEVVGFRAGTIGGGNVDDMSAEFFFNAGD